MDASLLGLPTSPFHVLVISYHVLQKDSTYLSSVRWHTMVMQSHQDAPGYVLSQKLQRCWAKARQVRAYQRVLILPPTSDLEAAVATGAASQQPGKRK
jgi:hypothetical protein